MDDARRPMPIFPLQTVLFPEGLLPLRIFEARYMDMIARCLRNDDVFGVNLIAEGNEVGRPARPHEVGVTARIVEWDMAQPGLLHVLARGERRFRIRRSELTADGLVQAEVDWLEQEVPQPVPPGCVDLVALLRQAVEQAGDGPLAESPRFDDATWVGYRLAEALPLAAAARQRLLELDDARVRLELLGRALRGSSAPD